MSAHHVDMLSSALEYARRGWAVVPLHTPDASERGGCSCHRPACDSVGKHPRTANGLKDASLRYAWEASSHPDDVSIARLPEYLHGLSKKKRTQRAASPEDDVTVLKGARNETLFKLACKVRRPGVGEEGILQLLLMESQRRCMPPLDEQEVAKIARSATRYEPEDRYYASADAPPPTVPSPDWLESPEAKTRLARHGHITMADVLSSALNIEKARWSRSDQTRAGICMARLKWRRERPNLEGSRATVFMPPEPSGRPAAPGRA